MYQNAFSKYFFPVYKPEIFRPYQAYSDNLLLSSAQLLALQNDKLQALLQHAHQKVPYYRQQWRELGVELSNLNDVASLASLPVLEKKDIVANFDEISANEILENTYIKATGGSTGDPFRFRVDYQSDELRQAIMWRGYGWLGAGLGCRSLYLWGADVGAVGLRQKVKNSLYHRLYNRRMLNSFKMEIGNLKQYVDEINRYKPEALVAYVNPLVVLAKEILAKGYKIHSPVTILTGAEPLYEFQRELIEKAFSCKVFNTYGCREFMLIAAECAVQNGLHINMDHLVVETVDDNNQPVRGEPGDLLITDLSNYGMPFIRYRNGDRAILSDRQCECGNPLPLIEKIEGRKLDCIKTTQGKTIPGEIFPHLLKEVKGIDRFQLVQNSYETIDLLIVANKLFVEEDRAFIELEIGKYTQGELVINFVFVNQIPLTPSGKQRVTICNV